MNLPNLFIIGAPKCGTTSMVKYLNSHTDIFMADGEPHYFGRDIKFHHFKMSEKKYLKQFKDVKNEKIIGEKSTWYLFSEYAAKEIYEFNPEAKIIIQLRNPVEVAYSLYCHSYYRYGRENVDDFEKALDMEPLRKKGKKVPSSVRFKEQLFYTEVPKYSNQIKRYVDCFGWDHIKLIFFEDLKSNPQNVYSETLKFLGLNDIYLPEFTIENKSKKMKNRMLNRMIGQYIVEGLRPYKYQFNKLIPSSLMNFLKNNIAKISEWNSEEFEAGPISPKVQKRLLEKFETDVLNLNSMIEKDVTHWLDKSKHKI